MGDRSNLGFGCVSLTQHAFLRDAQNILAKAYDEGITHFDTAPVYGNGFSEKILGNFIKKKRSSVTITTKCGLGNFNQPTIHLKIALPLNAIKNKLRKITVNVEPAQSTLLPFRSIDINYVRQHLEKSLKNLQTEFIDYYLLHEAMPSFLTPDTLDFLNEQKQKGIIGKLGIAANFINLLHANNNDLEGFTVLQYENGPNYKTDDLIIKYPGKKHFYHSALRSISYLDKKYSNSEWAGIILNRASKINPSGKILFSTTKSKRLMDNLNAYEKYNELPLETLNTIVDGIY
jgi:diketogulonate reductase-like aldo/keto reductase